MNHFVVISSLLLSFAWHSHCRFDLQIQPLEPEGVHETVIDLSYALEEGTIVYPEVRDYDLNYTSRGYRRIKQVIVYQQDEEIALSTHSGTHLDAPIHYIEGGKAVDELPLEQLINRPGVVIDVTSQAALNRDYEVTYQDLKEWEARNGQIPHGAIVLIRTGFSKYWNNRLYYTGTESRNADELSFPGMGAKAAEWLVNNRRVYGVGIETLSLDPGRTNDLAAHLLVLGSGAFIVENINWNIAKLPERSFRIDVLPMNIKGAGGAPCRIIARIGETREANSYELI